MSDKNIELKVGEIVPKNYYKIVQTQSIGGLHRDYSVTFRVTEACDLKCNYCHWHSGRHYNYDDIIETIDKLFEFFDKEQIKSVAFYYHGGEATRHPKILDILKYIKQKSQETRITAYNEMQTNLTLQTEKLVELLPYCDQLNISFHYLELKTHNSNNKLDMFNKNFEMLKEKQIEIRNFDIMLENVENEDQLNEFYSLIKYYLTYDKILNSEMIYGFCHYKYNEQTAEKHIAFYKKYNKTEQQYDIDGTIYTTNDLFQKGVNNVGWHCKAGQQSITINGDGNVFHCGIHMTNYLRECIPETPYTNLIHDKIGLTKLSLLYKTGTICRWDYCGGDFYLGRTPPK